MGCLSAKPEGPPPPASKAPHQQASLISSAKYSMDEVKKHNTDRDCWIVIDRKVYNPTPYLNDHPGGKGRITAYAGSDCTRQFNTIHSPYARSLLKKYYVGDLREEEDESERLVETQHPASTSTMSSPVALVDVTRKVLVALKSRENLSRNTRLLRFSLETDEHRLGLPVGGHIYVSAKVNDMPCSRAYTPTSRADVKGHFDLVVKVYFKGEHPKFPEGGRMSQYLDALRVGETIEVTGPLGHFSYLGQGRLEVDDKRSSVSQLGFICGGSGITPAYQVIQSVLDDASDRTLLWLLFANQTVDDILLRDQLDRWATDHPTRFKLRYTVSEPPPEGSVWDHSVGRIDAAMIRAHMPPPGESCFIGMCGPPGMIKEACIPNLLQLGYSQQHFMAF